MVEWRGTTRLDGMWLGVLLLLVSMLVDDDEPACSCFKGANDDDGFAFPG